MGSVERHVDVVVVGAGTAGANVAWQFASRGRRVLVLERRCVDAAGAQWVNGVLDWQFQRAGVDPPSGEERRRSGERIHLRAAADPTTVTLNDAPTVAADMTLLGRRLRQKAMEARAEIIDRVGITDVALDMRGRVRSILATREGATSERIRADLFVDASGRGGALRRQSPTLASWCPPLSADELCSASDAHHRITDRSAALRFLDRHGAALGDTVTIVGVRGGFSTCAVSISSDLDRVGILVGCLANGRYSTGPRMISDLCAAEPWIGEQLDIGSGVIPLRRPHTRITAAGLALVGDAACQVFPAHGSGIGIGLIAGTMLADGIAACDDPGDAHSLWAGYQARFQHEFGGLLGAYDALRRLTTRLGETGVAALMRAGVTGPSTLRAGLEQRWAAPPAGEVARSVQNLAREPSLAAQVLPALARARLLLSHGRSHPTDVDLVALDRWDRRTTTLLGALPS